MLFTGVLRAVYTWVQAQLNWMSSPIDIPKVGGFGTCEEDCERRNWFVDYRIVAARRMSSFCLCCYKASSFWGKEISCNLETSYLCSAVFW